MEAALNKSLDDLIAEQRTKKQEKKDTRRGKRTGGGEDAPRGPGPRRQSGGPRNAPKVLSITVRGGGVAKARGGRGAGAVREERERQDPRTREAALEGDAKWGHDMFRGQPGGGGGRGPRAGRGPRDPSSLGTKLFISNLHYNVTGDDIKELFATCGKVVSHKVHYDRSDRSEGTAEVIYEQAGDAERAMRRYNNVQLDGQPMEIELIAKAAAGAGGGASGGPRTLSSGIRISGEKGGTRMVQLTRHFQQAAGGTSRVRGRGSVRSGRSGVAAMQE